MHTDSFMEVQYNMYKSVRLTNSNSSTYQYNSCDIKIHNGLDYILVTTSKLWDADWVTKFVDIIKADNKTHY